MDRGCSSQWVTMFYAHGLVPTARSASRCACRSAEFRPSRSQRRCRESQSRRDASSSANLCSHASRAESFDLYLRYLRHQHPGSPDGRIARTEFRTGAVRPRSSALGRSALLASPTRLIGISVLDRVHAGRCPRSTTSSSPRRTARAASACSRHCSKSSTVARARRTHTTTSATGSRRRAHDETTRQTTARTRC